MRALVFRPGERGEIVEVPDPKRLTESLMRLQELVGGWLVAVPLPMGHFAMVNEEGKLNGLPLNRTVSHLFTMRSEYMPDTVVGTAVVVGPVNRDGDNTDVTDEFISFVRDLGFMEAAA